MLRNNDPHIDITLQGLKVPAALQDVFNNSKLAPFQGQTDAKTVYQFVILLQLC